MDGLNAQQLALKAEIAQRDQLIQVLNLRNSFSVFFFYIIFVLFQENGLVLVDQNSEDILAEKTEIEYVVYLKIL